MANVVCLYNANLLSLLPAYQRKLSEPLPRLTDEDWHAVTVPINWSKQTGRSLIASNYRAVTILERSPTGSRVIIALKNQLCRWHPTDCWNPMLGSHWLFSLQPPRRTALRELPENRTWTFPFSGPRVVICHCNGGVSDCDDCTFLRAMLQ
ncbi:hypothetical protein J6590_008682 [Homalodisca vitripennis]|nr:hypothetical protein J6590_008679 [Homalodisca vitripennis]KAG8259647.1 hypothetical protein J6590_008682 [Homalodisca vitripennis]